MVVKLDRNGVIKSKKRKKIHVLRGLEETRYEDIIYIVAERNRDFILTKTSRCHGLSRYKLIMPYCMETTHAEV